MTVLTAVKLALALVLGDGTPDTEELSVPFAMVVGYNGAEAIEEEPTEVITAEESVAKETGASLVAAAVVDAPWLLADAAAEDGAGAEDATADGAAEVGAAAEV